MVKGEKYIAINQAIQVLRGGGVTTGAKRTMVLKPGQPYWDKNNNLLYFGDGTSQLMDLKPLNKKIYYSRNFQEVIEFSNSEIRNTLNATVDITYASDILGVI